METKLYQIDLQDPEPNHTKTIIAEWDGYKQDGLWATAFDAAYLAPDCKIYIVPSATIEYLHVINYPNRKGKAAMMEQRAIKTPTKVSWGMPNYPHFRLGKEGEAHTPCDSTINPYITVTKNIKEEVPVTFAVYPNPAQDIIQVDLFGFVQRFEHGTWELYDMAGRKTASFPLFQGHSEYVFDIANIPDGVYVWRVALNGITTSFAGKIIIMKGN